VPPACRAAQPEWLPAVVARVPVATRAAVGFRWRVAPEAAAPRAATPERAARPDSATAEQAVAEPAALVLGVPVARVGVVPARLA
jgi:hypothetical protein